MLDFEVQRCTRRCSKTDRELQPSETFFSVLLNEGSRVVRYDYCQDAWEGPPPDALGWWKSKMPDPDANKIHWAPNDVMLHYFVQLADQDDKQDERYVLALLLVRRRIVRLEASRVDEQGREVLELFCPRNEACYEVPVVDPSPQRVGQIQEELAALLFGDSE